MLFCSNRRRRKTVLVVLLWLLVILTGFRIALFMFEYSGDEKRESHSSFLNFLMAPFIPVRTIAEHEIHRVEKYELFQNEKKIISGNEEYLSIGKEIRQKYENKWKLKLRKSHEDEGYKKESNKDLLRHKYAQVNTTYPTKSPTTPNLNEKLSKSWLQQKCKVPDLDPFNPEIAAFVEYDWVGVDCSIKQKGYVKNGKLVLNLKSIEAASYQYIRRENEDVVRLSEHHSLMNPFSGVQEIGRGFCLKMTTRSPFVMTAFNHKLQEYDGQSDVDIDMGTTASATRCTKERMFTFKNGGKLYHVLSNRCLITAVSGKELVLGLSNKPEQCDGDAAGFSLNHDGRIQHNETSLCITNRTVATFQFFWLGPCSSGTRFYAIGNHIGLTDVSVTIPLKEDYLRVEYIQKGYMYEEFYMYPLKQKQMEDKQKRVSRDENKLNILMLMVDSLSRASVQRYMNETYAMLDNDPNTVIMKGQTINGDGTTAQILAILMGKLEKELPEARRGFENSTYVDAWPSIVTEYEELGYHTVYSEDYPAMNIFNYRLKGFNKSPATKYLRPWWMGANDMFRMSNQHSEKCQHMFTFEYLKNYFKEFKDEKKFIFTCSNVAHNNPPHAVLLDADMKSFYEHLRGNGHLENTIVIFFADHGDRTSSFRAFMQGKLEERLPFVSLTFPSWFHRKFPREMENIKRNSHVLTTHYDMHATLKHLQNFPNGIYKHKYGHSYFTDIVQLNRTCSDAGIDNHWCPCLSYKKIDVSSELVKKMTREVIQNVNNKLKNHSSPKVQISCAELQLDKIKTANEKSTNKDVENFFETTRNEECDECGIKRNKTLNFKTKMYEITFTVLPSNGIFEATVMHDIKKNKMTVGEISRLNKYGNQPSCIANEYPYLRKFCYCKDSLN